MAEKNTTSTDTPVVSTADHDRVQMLSIAKDGTLDQSPGVEIIGDKDAAVEATKEQFRQIAVANVDAEKRADLGLAGTTDTAPGPDAQIDKLRAEHDKAAAAAEKKAESVVNSLSKG